MAAGVQVIRRRAEAKTDHAFRAIVRVDASPCYDLPSSLRALYSPRTYAAHRHWAGHARRRLPRELHDDGRFFFQGHDTSIGVGIVGLVPDLPHGATPTDLIAAVRALDARSLAGLLLEGAGSLPPTQREGFRAFLASRPTRSEVMGALRRMRVARRDRFERILLHPDEVQGRLVTFLEEYHSRVFVDEVDGLRDRVDAAARLARDTLAVMPTPDAIERLTGGYTLAIDLPLDRLILAPVVFLYGIPPADTEGDREGRIDARLALALKALSDETRLRILRLVVERPRMAPELVVLLGLTPPTIHHHVAQLRAAELIRQERTRDGMLLTVRPDGIRRFRASLHGLLDDTEDG